MMHYMTKSMWTPTLTAMFGPSPNCCHKPGSTQLSTTFYVFRFPFTGTWGQIPIVLQPDNAPVQKARRTSYASVLLMSTSVFILLALVAGWMGTNTYSHVPKSSGKPSQKSGNCCSSKGEQINIIAGVQFSGVHMLLAI